ncbi:hypothetical protein HOG17_05525 [Candidatus Peregrinibacteria bacterium]|jgi:hypothetical protein|nr:hypothetical protein [Candidatus Peregrinibacteria bacterium]MBT4148137.1 hypothetical protein [Candidatus Peregrinibacteria bacterium]MBT4366624.1 hypothetical protein [Candidatus Peregrinibacteria bacterium]MBT4455611.1 hypothetical protein [Candidatus Peregrinibacteria bacterium]
MGVNEPGGDDVVTEERVDLEDCSLEQAQTFCDKQFGKEWGFEVVKVTGDSRVPIAAILHIVIPEGDHNMNRVLQRSSMQGWGEPYDEGRVVCKCPVRKDIVLGTYEG